MKNFIFVFLVSYFSVTSTAADLNSPAADDDCGEVNSSLRLGPMRDQRDMGWCFANTAGDLLTHAYHQDFVKKTFAPEVTYVDLSNMQVSSMFAALTYYEAQLDPKINPNIPASISRSLFKSAGYIYDAIKLAQKKQFLCTQKLDEDLVNRGTKRTLSEKFKLFENLYELFHEWLKGNRAAGEEALKIVEEIRQSKSILTDFSYEELEKAFTNKNMNETTIAILNIACRETKMKIEHFPDFEHFFTTSDSPDAVWHATGQVLIKNFDYRKQIDMILNNKTDPKPVGITYDVGEIVSDPKKLGSGPHASTITGRKKINGVCSYRIRNSWGNGCTWGYGADAINTYKYKCEGGNIWVPGSEINNLVREIVYQK